MVCPYTFGLIVSVLLRVLQTSCHQWPQVIKSYPPSHHNSRKHHSKTNIPLLIKPDSGKLIKQSTAGYAHMLQHTCMYAHYRKCVQTHASLNSHTDTQTSRQRNARRELAAAAPGEIQVKVRSIKKSWTLRSVDLFLPQSRGQGGERERERALPA